MFTDDVLLSNMCRFIFVSITVSAYGTDEMSVPQRETMLHGSLYDCLQLKTVMCVSLHSRDDHVTILSTLCRHLTSTLLNPKDQ